MMVCVLYGEEELKDSLMSNRLYLTGFVFQLGPAISVANDGS